MEGSGAQATSSWPAPPDYYRSSKKRAPPPVPAGSFQLYGLKREALGTKAPVAELEEQVYSASDDAEALVELRRLNRSTLEAFLELLRTMQRSPTQCAADVAKIRTLLLNLQHLLNSLRPYAAREEVIAAVGAQLQSKQDLIDELRNGAAEIKACGEEEEGEAATAGPPAGVEEGADPAADSAESQLAESAKARGELEQLAKSMDAPQARKAARKK